MRFKAARSMDQQAFIQCLVRIAIRKYVVTGECPDAPLAVQVFLREMSARLPLEATHNTNSFRSRYCYLREMDEALRTHLPSIKALYVRYAALNEDRAAPFVDDTLMDLGEWMHLLDHVGFFETSATGKPLLTPFLAKMIFVWSRVRYLNDATDGSVKRLRHMNFKDFMEVYLLIY